MGWGDRLNDLGSRLEVYQSIVGAVTAVVLVAGVVVVVNDGSDAGPAGSGRAGEVRAGDPRGPSGVGGGVDADGTEAGEPGGETAVAGGAAAGSGGAPRDRRGQAVQAPATAAGGGDPMTHPNCDPQTGRVAVPSLYAPPCVPEWRAGSDNGGATHRGISSDTITVVYRHGAGNPAAEAILRAAGADDSKEDIQATFRAYRDYFQHHYETYGREVEIVFFDATGPSDDEEAGRADALRAVSEFGAFASWGGSGAYAEELAARGVLCIDCPVSEPIESYHARAPYFWGTLMSSNQAYMHRAEYIGKRLAGKNAQWSGDLTMRQQPRRFGIVYYETEDGSYGPGVDFFEQELGRYGVGLDDRIEYVLDLNTAPQDARTIIARLRNNGISTVIFAGDPLMPIFLTNEARNQLYEPEWFITGSALTDTTFFARTYDRTQWSRAFGVSMLAARGTQELGETYRVHMWHHGTPPQAEAGYSLIYAPVWMFFTGVHLAGPNLNPQTFRDGMFAFPPSPPDGGIMSIHTSFGEHGFWPWTDYTRFNDMTEIWWDATASGEDEIGQDGVGMYRYVDGGRRYLPGEWPDSDPRPFDRDGAVTFYSERPEPDQYPEYPPPR